ncbi:MAG TPA: OsmC family peroxiredoxin [Gaiellaceae bacterium]|nr:OsmC family peroxiredoxin [Gaiellaceae bacterium]
MAVEHTASATWEGDLMSGFGTVSLGSGAVSGVSLTWRARAEDGSAGSSPEELIAAALASCFSMALSHGLAQGGHAPARIETEATAAFDKTDDGFRVTKIALKVQGDVPGLDEAAFKEAADGAKTNCPVSKALEGNVEITLDASLAS